MVQQANVEAASIQIKQTDMFNEGLIVMAVVCLLIQAEFGSFMSFRSLAADFHEEILISLYAYQ